MVRAGPSLVQSAHPCQEQKTLSSIDSVARGLPFLVAVSGAAALVYESLWLRSLGLVFGHTTGAVAMVLTVLMGGLALGSAIAARRRTADPLRVYALLELGIGGAAIVTLPLLHALPWAYGTLAGRLGLEGPLELLVRVVLSAVVLLPATVLLGMTVPLAVEVLVRAGRSARASFGRLYLLSTLGGAAGVALVPFVLVPVLGVRGTLVAGALGSLAVGGLALRWRRDTGLLTLAEATSPAGASADEDSQRSTVRLGVGLAAVAGAATFGVGVLWSRSYALVIGSSVYAFSLLLLAVLLGLAAGATVYGRVHETITRPTRTVGWLFVTAAVGVLVGQWMIGRLPEVSLATLRVLPVSFTAHLLAALVLCLATMLPVTFALGLMFPLLLHLADAGSHSAQEVSGRLYAWSTAGAVAGGLAAALVLVPRLGLQPPYLLFAALLLGGGMWALAEAASWPSALRASVPVGLVAALVALSPRWTPWDPVLMSSGVYGHGLEWSGQLDSAFELGTWQREQRELVFYREGPEAVVGVSETDEGRRVLSVNGRSAAGTGVEDVVTQELLAHLPMLLHPSPQRVLVIGWGTGATAAAVARYPTVESVDCVEIEPAVLEAAPLFEHPGGELLEDPRFRVAFRDGRNHLLRAPEHWDVIVSAPSSSWTSGVFTREFYEVARSRLAPGGVFGQRLHYSNLDPPDVKVAAKTFLSVFPHASLWLVPPVGRGDEPKNLGADLLLVGTGEPHALEWDRLEQVFGETPPGESLRATGVLDDPLALVATWAMGRAEMEEWAEDQRVFPSGTPLNTDDRPRVELAAPRRVMWPADAARAARDQYAAMSEAAGDAREILRGYPGPDTEPAVVAAVYRDLAELYIDAGQGVRAFAALDAAVAALPDDALAHTRVAELLLERGRGAEALGRLRVAVRMDPESFHAWDLLGQLAIERRDYPLAEEAHRAMLRREPGNVEAWLRLAAVQARQAKWGEAREALVWARRLDPEAQVDPELERYIAKRAAEARAFR